MTSSASAATGRQRPRLIALYIVLGAVLAALPAPDRAADAAVRWTATHTLFVADVTQPDRSIGDPASFSRIQLFVTAGEVPARVADALGPQINLGDAMETLSVTADVGSGAIRITSVREDPDEAALIADTFGFELANYFEERQEAIRDSRLTSNLDRLAELEIELAAADARVRQDPSDEAARADLASLGAQYAVVFEQHNATQFESGPLVFTTVESAQPVEEVDLGLGPPRTRLGRGILGAVVGLVVGLAVGFVTTRADPLVRTVEQVERLTGHRANVRIPKAARRASPVVIQDGNDPEAEGYRWLRNALAGRVADRALERAPVIAVAAPEPRDGASTVAASLDAAFGERDLRTIAVNADFRQPALHTYLGSQNGRHLPLDPSTIETIETEQLLIATALRNVDYVDLIGLPSNSPGELTRATFAVLPRLAQRATAVVVDCAPLGSASESLDVLARADLAVLVVRLGHTPIRSIRRVIDLIAATSDTELLVAILGAPADAALRADRRQPVSGTTTP